MIYNYINKNLPKDVDQLSGLPEDSEFYKALSRLHIKFL